MLHEESPKSGKILIVDDKYFSTRKHLALLWEEFTHGGGNVTVLFHMAFHNQLKIYQLETYTGWNAACY
jgi:hypothetical protein